MDVLWTLLAGAVMLFGLVATVIPVVPDLLLIWLAGLGYGLLVGWGPYGPWLFGLMTVIGLAGELAEPIVSGAGARAAGASRKAIVAGLIAGFVGFFILPPFGLIIGLLGGTFLIELLSTRSARQAGKATAGMGLGYGASFGVKLVAGLLMVAAWLVWVIWG